jgi:hypothetical protein
VALKHAPKNMFGLNFIRERGRSVLALGTTTVVVSHLTANSSISTGR